MIAYHAVTERPMHAGQRIIFDEAHHNGVYRRVCKKLPDVEAIYANPAGFDADALEHHTAVALRELALEEVRRAKYPQYPSRMACLYVSQTLEEAERWAAFFAQLGRPTYQIVKLEIRGNCFTGDAELCFRGRTDRAENLCLAERYWAHAHDPDHPPAVCEMLVDGEIIVLEIIREIGASITPEE